MRTRSFVMFSLVVFFVQVFVLNNISLSPLIAPMVYIVLIVMLPIETPQWKMLCAGLALGVVMDITMGTIGLNTLVTLPVAFFRRPMLYTFTGLSSMSKEEGVPSVRRLGGRFHQYVISVIVIHSIIYYFVEWLSFDNFGMLLLRIICSTLVSLLFDYILIMLFMKRLTS